MLGLASAVNAALPICSAVQSRYQISSPQARSLVTKASPPRRLHAPMLPMLSNRHLPTLLRP